MIDFHLCNTSNTRSKISTFSFNDFYKYGHVSHVPRIPEPFLEWFIGFFEGDGCLSYTNEGTYNRLYFIICQKEKAIITKLITTFGFGVISCFKRNTNTYWQWRITSKKHLERIAFLLSGNLILSKRQSQFVDWIKIGQKKGIFLYPFNINKPWTAKIDITNGWLSGFIDAEGCFYANFDKTWKKSNLDLFANNNKNQNSYYKWPQGFSLKQSSQTGNTEIIFNRILILFESKAKIYKLKKKNNK